MALAQQKWTESAGYYQKAMQLAPAFSFAGANRTLALYAGGQTNEAMREMRYHLDTEPPLPCCSIDFYGMSYLTASLSVHDVFSWCSDLPKQVSHGALCYSASLDNQDGELAAVQGGNAGRHEPVTGISLPLWCGEGVPCVV